jgi:hypothetical protein
MAVEVAIDFKNDEKEEVKVLDSYSLYAALYLIGFAALHSFLASLPAKSAAKRRFGSRVDPWYLVLFSASAVITIFPLFAIHSSSLAICFSGSHHS